MSERIVMLLNKGIVYQNSVSTINALPMEMFHQVSHAQLCKLRTSGDINDI